jgi:hypothetical protein
MRPAPPRPGEPPRPQAIPPNPNGPSEPQGTRNAAGTSVTSSQGFHGTSVPAGGHGQHAPNPKVVRIGQYELGSTLGVGSFGKVKRKSPHVFRRCTPDQLLLCYLHSCNAFTNWTQSCHEDYKPEEDESDRHERTGQAGNPIPQGVETSSHHQAVSGIDDCHYLGTLRFVPDGIFFCRYEVITTPTDIIMVIEYAGGELFNYIVEKGKVCLTVYQGLPDV